MCICQSQSPNLSLLRLPPWLTISLFSTSVTLFLCFVSKFTVQKKKRHFNYKESTSKSSTIYSLFPILFQLRSLNPVIAFHTSLKSFPFGWPHFQLSMSTTKSITFLTKSVSTM